MPDITLPDVHLPDIKLPDSLRDVTKKDIQSTINDRIPRRIQLPDIDLSNVQLPKAVEDRLKTVERRLDDLDLPKAVGDRLPRRRRSSPILPIAAVLAVGSALAAAWWLISSPTAAVRVREAADRTWRRVTGQDLAVTRYDDDEDLGSLVPPARSDLTASIVTSETWPDTDAEVGETVRSGNGSGISSNPTGV